MKPPENVRTVIIIFTKALDFKEIIHQNISFKLVSTINGYKPLYAATSEHSFSKDLFDIFSVLWMGFQPTNLRLKVRHPNHFTKGAQKMRVLLV